MINPDDDIFWRKVRESYDVVYFNSENEVTIEVGNREAKVYWYSPTQDVGYMAIEIREIEVKPPTLIVP